MSNDALGDRMSKILVACDGSAFIAIVYGGATSLHLLTTMMRRVAAVRP